MRRDRISKIQNYTRLYVKDKKFLEEQVIEFRGQDKNFDTLTSAIRYYVRIGITANMQTDKLIDALDNKVVKRSQKNAVREELKPMANVIKNLYEIIEKKIVEDTENTNKIISSSIRIENLLRTQTEDVLGKILELSNSLLKIESGNRESLRNIIILRTVIYLLMVGFKTGRLEEGDLNERIWVKTVEVTHRKAKEMTDVEIELLRENKLSEKDVMAMTKEIYYEIKHNRIAIK